MIRTAIIAFTVGSLLAGNITYRVMDQTAEVAALHHKLAVQEQVVAQARLAKAVASAERDRLATVAQEYQSVKDALKEGNFDEPLPAEFRDLILDVLRVGAGGGFDGPVGIP